MNVILTALGESMAAAAEMNQAVGTIALDAHALSERSRSQEGMLGQFKLGEG